ALGHAFPTPDTAPPNHLRGQPDGLTTRGQRGYSRVYRVTRTRLKRRALRQHHHPGADIDAAEQVDHVLIGQADAAGRDELADGCGIVGAVDAVLAGTEIDRAGAERIAGAAGHETRPKGLGRD